MSIGSRRCAAPRLECKLLLSASKVPSGLFGREVLAARVRACDSSAGKTAAANMMKNTRKSKFGKDKRRKHRHWQVTVFYHDGEKFARVYIDHDKAVRFAERQKKSPVVKTARVIQVG